jgi:cephalosporin hydroxylase
MATTIIDEDAGLVIVRDGAGERRLPMASAEAFKAASDAWLRVGWDAKHAYSFTWMGRPIIQLPEDMIRLQEVIWTLKPDILVETGIAHGGSLIFYASLFEAMGKGRVIGIDIDIRAHNRAAIEAHPMAARITMLEGSSIDPAMAERVRQQIGPGERVLVVLDSNHTRDHVLGELRAYAPMVPVGGYAVATDGIMRRLAGAPRSQDDWTWNNPAQAAADFVAEDPRFVIAEPPWLFNEGLVAERVTHWPDAFVQRVR